MNYSFAASKGVPGLSVIIGSTTSSAGLTDCLRALKRQSRDETVEIVVVDNSGSNAAEIIRDYPEVRLILQPPDKLMPELWETGIRQTTGEYVALTTSQFVPDQAWVEQIFIAHRSTDAAIGGAIENDPNDSLVGWAIYFCRYSSYMLPFPPHKVTDFAGDNATYKRSALVQCSKARQNGFWESFVHELMIKDGLTLRVEPAMIVYHKQSFSFRGFIKQRFQHGRKYANERAARTPFAKTIVYAAAAPILPFLLLGRISRRVVGRRRHLTRLILSLPVLFAFLCSWSIGEAVGNFWTAKPGGSPSFEKSATNQ